MGLFNFIRKRDETETRTTENTSQTETTPVVNDLLLQALMSDNPITREQALTVPTVSGAVDFISNTIASMPVKLFKYKQGRVEEIENDTRTKLLNSDTGDTLDAFQMKKAMVEDYLLGKVDMLHLLRLNKSL